jgi:hypothetical protein
MVVNNAKGASGIFVFAAALSVAALAAAPGTRGDQPAAQPGGGDYLYVEDLGRIVGVCRGSWMVYVKLDAQGELIPEGKHHPALPSSNIPSYTPVNFVLGEPRPCYELHSGRLVKGVMTNTGHFVPDAGSTVKRFEEFRFSEGAPQIRNLPGSFMRRDKIEERRKWLAEHMADHPEAYGKEKARLDAAIEKKK